MSDSNEPVEAAFELLGRLAHVEDREALERTIELLRRAVDAGGADRPRLLAGLGSALLMRYQRGGDLDDIEQAVRWGVLAVRETPEDDPRRAGHLSDLGVALAPGSVSRASGPTSIMPLPRPGSPSAPRRSTAPGARCTCRISVRHWGRASGVPEHPGDLDDAIAADRLAVEAAAPASAYHPMYLSNLAAALFLRFERRGEVADLDEAIACGERAAQACPPEHPRRAAMLSNLGATRRARFERSSDLEDLAGSISAGRQAVAATPVGRPERPRRLSNLGNALRMRFERSGSAADLDEAISAGEEACALAPLTSPDRPGILLNLNSALAARFGSSGRRSDLDQMVGNADQAVRSTPSGHPDRARYQDNLGTARWERFRQLGDPADLEQAAAAGRDAVRATPSGDIALPGRLANLAIVLGETFELTGQVTDLDESIDTITRAIELASPDHDATAMYLSNLAAQLQARFEYWGSTADIDRAVDSARSAAARTPSDDRRRAARLSNLGTALHARFDGSGRQTDLDEAIEIGRQVIVETEPHGRDWAMYQAHLCGRLTTRFDRFGEWADVDEAVAAGRAAVAATPASHVRRASSLSNLGAALHARFERSGEDPDLDESIDLERAAVAGSPSDGPDHAIYLSNLCGRLLLRFSRSTHAADLDDAIAAGRMAVAATPLDNPGHALHSSNLAIALHIRSMNSADPADLDDAIGLGRAAVAAAPADDPQLARYLSALGNALRTRAARADDAEDAHAAIRVWRQGASSPTSAVHERVDAARKWADLAEKLDAGSELALDGYSTAVGLLPLLAWHGLARPGQERLLGQLAGLACAAAACALTAGRPRRALELVEQGRAVLWSQHLDARTDFDDLARVAPTLAARLAEVRCALDETGGMQSSGEAMAGPQPTAVRAPHRVDGRMRLARGWDELIEQARAIDGFAELLVPPPAHDLVGAAIGGAVVVVNIAGRRCDALLVADGEVDVVHLTGLTASAAYDMSNTYLEAWQEFQAGARSAADIGILELTVSATLEWIWDIIAEPVLQRLGHVGTPTKKPWPRIWWCPTGPLTVLPLHAAGHHDPEDRDAGRTVLDRVVSSYAPSLRGLRRTRRRSTSEDRPREPRMLLVALPETPNRPDLPSVDVERAVLAQVVPANGMTTLLGPDATRSAVLQALADHSWVHFACHGEQDLDSPSTGGLLLTDATLTVGEIGRQDLRHGELAFLSACKGATGGTVLIDETVTLAAALHFAGYRHVVGALWTIGDQTAADLVTLAYPEFARNGRLTANRAADILSESLRRLRDRYPNNPSAWSQLVHIGP